MRNGENRKLQPPNRGSTFFKTNMYGFYYHYLKERHNMVDKPSFFKIITYLPIERYVVFKGNYKIDQLELNRHSHLLLCKQKGRIVSSFRK